MTGLGEARPGSAGAIWRATLPVWAGLMALLVVTLVGAYLPLGRLNLVLSLMRRDGRLEELYARHGFTPHSRARWVRILSR